MQVITYKPRKPVSIRIEEFITCIFIDNDMVDNSIIRDNKHIELVVD
jgi:hypothetical protein